MPSDIETSYLALIGEEGDPDIQDLALLRAQEDAARYEMED